jgi:hypothetical protein
MLEAFRHPCGPPGVPHTDRFIGNEPIEVADNHSHGHGFVMRAGSLEASSSRTTNGN